MKRVSFKHRLFCVLLIMLLSPLLRLVAQTNTIDPGNAQNREVDFYKDLKVRFITDILDPDQRRQAIHATKNIIDYRVEILDFLPVRSEMISENELQISFTRVSSNDARILTRLLSFPGRFEVLPVLTSSEVVMLIQDIDISLADDMAATNRLLSLMLRLGARTGDGMGTGILSSIVEAGDYGFSISETNLRTAQALLQDEDFLRATPSNYRIVISYDSQLDKNLIYFMEDRSVLTGREVANCDRLISDNSSGSFPYLSLRLTRTGTRLFSEFSSRNFGRRAAMLLDNRLVSAPILQAHITSGEIQITGIPQDAYQYVLVALKSGELQTDVSLEFIP